MNEHRHMNHKKVYELSSLSCCVERYQLQLQRTSLGVPNNLCQKFSNFGEIFTLIHAIYCKYITLNFLTD